MATLPKNIKAARKKPGGSNVGKKRKTSGARQGPFIGPSGGAPKGSYPVTNKKQWKAALAYSRHAPNPAGIRAAANAIAKRRGWKEIGGYLPTDGCAFYPVDPVDFVDYAKGGWIKKAAASVKRRGTKGKCGPNCDRPGCTGRALALCHAFHTIARRRKNKEYGGYFEGPTLDYPFLESYINERKLGGSLTATKARKILHDGTVHGHPITDKQRKFFGAVASGSLENGGYTDLELEELGLGDFLKNNLQGILGGLKTAGGAALTATIPGLGALIGIPLMASGASDIIGDVSSNYQNKLAQDELKSELSSENDLMDTLNEEQRKQQMSQNRMNSIETMRSYAPVVAKGGYLEYGGQTHGGPDGGNFVDEKGNPVRLSGKNPVAKTERGEFAWRTPEGDTYIFSKKLGYANKFKKLRNKFSKEMGGNLQEGDEMIREAFELQANNLIEENEAARQGAEEVEEAQFGKRLQDWLGEKFWKSSGKTFPNPWYEGSTSIDPGYWITGDYPIYGNLLNKSIEQPNANLGYTPSPGLSDYEVQITGGKPITTPITSTSTPRTELLSKINSIPGNVSGYQVPTGLHAPTSKTQEYLAERPGMSPKLETIGNLLPFLDPLGEVLSGLSNYRAAKQRLKYLEEFEPETLHFAPVAAERVSYAPARKLAEEQADVSRRTAARTTRDLGLSGAATANVIGTTRTGVDRLLGEEIGKSVMAEANQNALFRQQANITNAQLQGQAGIYNAMIQNAYKSRLSEAEAAADPLSHLLNAGAQYFANLAGYQTDYATMKTIAPNSYWETEPFLRSKFLGRFRSPNIQFRGPKLNIYNKKGTD